jgi:fatty acid synthase subunit alpha
MRIVEIGPAPVLAGMMKRTIAQQYAAKDFATLDNREVWSYAKDRKFIYHEADPEPEVTAPMTAQEKEPVAVAPPVQPTVTLPPAPVLMVMDTAAEIPDEPVSNVDVIRALIAKKLKVKFSEIPVTSSVKELSKGQFEKDNSRLIG